MNEDTSLSKAVVTANSSGGYNIIRVEKVKILASATDKDAAEQIAAMFNRTAATTTKGTSSEPVSSAPKAAVKKVVRRRRRVTAAKKTSVSTGKAKIVKTKTGGKKKPGPKPGFRRRREVAKEGVDMDALTAMVGEVSGKV